MKKNLFSCAALLLLCLSAAAIDHPGITEARRAPGRFSLIGNGVPAAVVTDPAKNFFRRSAPSFAPPLAM